MNTYTLKRLIAIATGVLAGIVLLLSIVTIGLYGTNVDTKKDKNSTSTSANSFFVPSVTPSSRPTSPPSVFDNPTKRTQKKPNILLILADDVGTGDISFYWNTSIVKMPNLEYLAEQGVTFKNAHSSPLCAPSRYMLLSGNYAHRGVLIGGTWNFKHNHGNQFRSFQKSIAQVLRDEAGYHTAMFGKWHLGSQVPPSGIYNYSYALSHPKHNWSQAIIDGPQDIGFDESLITCGGIQAPPYSFFRNGFLTTEKNNVVYWDAFSQHDMPNGISMIGKHGGEGDLNWDSTSYNMILVNETAAFIDNHMKDKPDDPFFAYVALGAVHIPHSPPNFYLDGSRICEKYPTRHLDMLLELDKVVGSLISIIEQIQATNNTIIIFTSDNGGLRSSTEFSHHSSGPLRGTKGQIYEGGHRVPMIWRYDGIFPKNESRNHMVGLNDVYATLCDIVGINVPYGSAYDSISFSKYLTSGNKTESLREYFPTWSYKDTKGMIHAIQYHGFKLIHDTESHQLSLYDIFNDIAETVDHSTKPVYLELMKSMYEKLLALGPCPDDVQDTFQLSADSGRLDGLLQEVDCSWFMTDTMSRCELHIEGELLCNSICGRFKTECENKFFRNQKWPSSLLL